MKNSDDTIGNRSGDLQVCSAVPQPLRHRVPPNVYEALWNYTDSQPCACVLTMHATDLNVDLFSPLSRTTCKDVAQ
jgi:hypothetical protein